MIRRINQRLKRLQTSLSDTYGTDISTPEARRAAWWHFQLMDHAFLRVWWTNFAEVAPGVFRQNQPSPARLALLRAQGIRSILNLRGRSTQGFYLFERESAARLGLQMADLQMSAKTLPARETLLALRELFETLPKPMLLHCKSGSDRTGLAAALYLMMIHDVPVAKAAKELSFRFLHRKKGPTGVLDHFLRVYAKAEADSGISLMDWIETVYDPAIVTASFKDWEAGNWDGPL